MTESREQELTGLLHQRMPDASDGQVLTARLEQYKIFVQSSESLVARRQTVNAFFLSLNTLMLGAIGLFVKDDIASSQAAASMSVFGLTGAVLSHLWYRLIDSYRQLNSGKFQVIEALERVLPAAVFTAEWAALAKGAVPSLYRSSTRTEMTIARVFLLLYGVTALAGFVLAAGRVLGIDVAGWVRCL